MGWFGKVVFLVRDGLAAYQLVGGVMACPDSYGRQQWGILHNGRKPDAATPREG